MPAGSIIATVVAYGAIAILLLSLNLTSRWRWWIKGSAIVVTGVFFFGSYIAISSLLGWSTQARVPVSFSLVATRVVEPDKFTGAPGAVYLWIERLDENNVPNGTPRGYRLPYTDELAQTAEDAQDLLDQGETVEGRVEQAAEDRDQQLAQAQDPPEENPGGQAGDQTAYPAIEFNLIFNDLPAVQLPDKGVL
jgi:hypothetical protein